MLEKAFGESVLSKTRAYEWHKAFKEVREIVKDMPRFGQTSSSTTELNIDIVKEMVLKKRYTSLRKLLNWLNISHESYRGQVSLDTLDRENSNPTFMERIITGDETWIYAYAMQTSNNNQNGGRKTSQI
ncbi:protein GVQW3-like [Lepeophtheirus salmonis]|uniref:protein GVQW3-like n=1 Tax=Lepeophtheirus salmonis TaxID=72036 RepID=UPI001AE7C86C|nr:uncharacterized protein LOC121120061 [Lepeophtheirus salmonis]